MSDETYEERLYYFVNSLNDPSKIEQIRNSISQHAGVTLSLCMPKVDKSKHADEKQSLHFLVESTETLGFFRLGRIMSPVKEMIGYDYSCDDDEGFEKLITVHLKDPSDPKIDEKLSEIVPLSQNHFEEIQKFLTRNFPEAFTKTGDFKKLGEKSYDQNFSSAKDEMNLVDFLVGLMSCASKSGIDASKLFREAESKLSQLGSSPSFRKK